MADYDSPAFDAHAFSGRVRLFPLPNLVMFPHVLLPLHVFEPRYRELMQATLDDDQHIAMALLRPGWENQYEGRPPIEPVACLGRVISHERLADGKFNLLLHGQRRLRVLRELPPTRAFREAQVEVLEDGYDPQGNAGRGALRAKLLELFQQRFAELHVSGEPIEKFLGSGVPLGPLTDIVAFSLDLELSVKQRLLTQANVDLRAQELLRCLSGETGELRRPFPPDFSRN